MNSSKNKWKNIWINENEQTTVRTHKWTDEQITNEEIIKNEDKWTNESIHKQQMNTTG